MKKDINTRQEHSEVLLARRVLTKFTNIRNEFKKTNHQFEEEFAFAVKSIEFWLEHNQ